MFVVYQSNCGVVCSVGLNMGLSPVDHTFNLIIYNVIIVFIKLLWLCIKGCKVNK